MANMSYCRFENTYGDLEDCLNAMLECECDEDARDFLLDMSEYERSAFERMRKLCVEFVKAHDRIMEAAEDLTEVEISPFE